MSDELRTLMAVHIDKMLWPALMFLLQQKKQAHGYELIQALHKMETVEGDIDPATVYRNLRRMEDEGLVSSYWESGSSGPARRLYNLSEKGEQALHLCASLISDRKNRLERFLRQYTVSTATAQKEALNGERN